MREAVLQNLILAQLADLGVFCWRSNSGAATRGDRLIRFGKIGQPDVMAILPGGRFLGVEVKSDRGKQTVEQRAFQTAVELAGGTYIVARELADVMVPVMHAIGQVAP